MGLPHYLAMTPEEFQSAAYLPEKIAWMSCHFSPGNAGLTHLPTDLPPGSILVLDDFIPPHNPDPAIILEQLSPLLDRVDGILLDFQRPDHPVTSRLAAALSTALPEPPGISEIYAENLDCPIFLSPVPLHLPLEVRLRPFSHRKIWLDTAPEPETLLVTSSGIQYLPCSLESSGPHHRDATLRCSYQISVSNEEVRFSLFRTREDLASFYSQAEDLGVSRIFSLYQDLERM